MMYESFYRLTANPFRLAPDPKFCFSHPSYDEAHAYLEYAFKLGEGFVIFTGRPGTGKTTLIHTFLNRLEVTQVVAAKLAVTNMNAADLLRAVAYAFDIEIEDLEMAAVLRRVEQSFMQQVRAGKRCLLIIDEAQGLSRSALEELRLLADLQTESRFLLQIFLVGHEKLREFMVSPEMEQFQQRVTGTCKLVPLNQQESRDYIEYRLCQVGWNGDPELTSGAVAAIHQYSDGIPRHINKLCTRLMLHGLLEKKHVLVKDDVLTVADGLKDELLAPMFTQQTAITANSASLAIQAPPVRKQARPKTRSAAKTTSSWSRTSANGKEKERATPVPGRVKQNVEPDAVFSVLAAVMLFLVVLVFNSDEDENNNGLRASQGDAYETWVQISRYYDGVHEDFPIYEEPAFVRENRAKRIVIAAQQQDTKLPVSIVMPKPEFAFEFEAEPEIVAEVEAPQAEAIEFIEVDVASELAAIEIVPAVAPPSVEQQPSVAVIQKQEVAHLLSLANDSLGEYRLLIPSGNNAYEYYLQVDMLDPGNKEAVRGIGRIAARYFALAEKAISRGDEEIAQLYIRRGLRIRPASSELLALQTAMIMSEIESAEVPPQQATVEVPPVEQQSFLARLKDIFNYDQMDVQAVSIWHDEDDEW